MDWGALLIAVITGGVGVAIVNAIANRKRVQTDCIKSLGEAYEARLLALNEAVARQDAKVAVLEAKVDKLNSELDDREVTIETLKRENAELTLQVEKLTTAVKARDKRIRELEKQLAEVLSRLDAMDEEGWVGGTD